MKLMKIINLVNQNEISKFYNILTDIISDEEITLEKKTDAENFVKTFNTEHIKKQYKERMQLAMRDDAILDIVADILIRDGNTIMSRDWFLILYKKEMQNISNQIKNMKEILKNGSKELESCRVRDYRIYFNCVTTAFNNDEERGSDKKISFDEITVLHTLKESLELSNTEARAIFLHATEVNLSSFDIDEIRKRIVEKGLAFYKGTEMNIYVPEEFIILMREIKGIVLAEKYQRRILKCLDDRMINKLKKKYGIKSKTRHEKIEEIIKQGTDIGHILNFEIYDDEIIENEKKKILQSIIDDKLELHLGRSGRTLKDKISLLIEYYLHDEIDTNIGISREGYDKMMKDLNLNIPDFLSSIKSEFELDEKVQMKSDILLEYNIKPKDVLYLLPFDTLKTFCKNSGINYRGKNLISQILHHYTESEDLYIENYSLIANNDLIGLKNNGLEIKSEEMGIRFEKVTKHIFKKLNLNVNEDLRNEVNSKINKADIILDVGNNNIYIVECKSSKKNFSSFSSVTRQISAYVNFYSKKGYNILGTILVSGNFSDDFKKECDIFSDFHLSLLEATSLYDIYEEFKTSKLSAFPHTLFRHGLIQSDIVIKAIRR